MSIISILEQHPRVSAVIPFGEMRQVKLKDSRDFHEVAENKGSQTEVPTQELPAHNSYTPLHGVICVEKAKYD